jgi:hypothetical protein
MVLQEASLQLSLLQHDTKDMRSNNATGSETTSSQRPDRMARMLDVPMRNTAHYGVA